MLNYNATGKPDNVQVHKTEVMILINITIV